MAREFAYNEATKFNGIIAGLTGECHGNVHDKGKVTITASSADTTSRDGKIVPYQPKVVADLQENSWFCSKNSSGQWICYDFKDMLVKPTWYSIRSYFAGEHGCHPKSWDIEVSNDGGSWDCIDQQRDNQDLFDGKFKEASFQITTEHDPVRYVRLRLVAKNHFPSDTLKISAFELFGTLSPKPAPPAE